MDASTSSKRSRPTRRYAQNSGGWIGKKHIQAVRKELSRIETLEGVLSPAAVVAAAADPKSVLHRFFQWDDALAAEQYRLWQARQIIRSVVIVSENAGEEISVRAWVNVTACENEDRFDKTSYMNVVDALQHPKYRQQVLQRAAREAKAWRERYQALHEFADVCAAIAKVRI